MEGNKVEFKKPEPDGFPIIRLIGIFIIGATLMIIGNSVNVEVAISNIIKYIVENYKRLMHIVGSILVAISGVVIVIYLLAKLQDGSDGIDSTGGHGL